MNQIIDNLVSLAKKHAPEILITMGISGVCAGTIIACKETKQIDPILEEHQEQIEKIKDSSEKGYIYDPDMDAKIEYTEKDRRKDITVTYFTTGFRLVKLYLPAGLLIGGSIGCIIGSHNIMAKRNAGLSAAYIGLSETFKSYRENIVEKFGESADVEARYNVKAKKIKGKNGEEDSVEYHLTDKTDISEYDFTRFFDAESKFWDKNINMNLMNIYTAQESIRRKMQYRKSGQVSFNEIAAELDIQPDIAKGAVIGINRKQGDPMGEHFQILVYVFLPTGERVKKKVEDAISEGDVIDPVILLDFTGLEPLIP